MSTNADDDLVFDEFRFASLGDARRVARLRKVADSVARFPSGSLPEQAGDDGQLEGTYRLLSNPHVSPEAVFASHVACTAQRAAGREVVLVIHDTTQFEFGGTSPRAGLGKLLHYGNQQGFLAHQSICLGLDGEPLGSLALYAWSRAERRPGRRLQEIAQSDPDREFLRWSEAVETTTAVLGGSTRAIHVMDRESDSMEFLAQMVENDQCFVVRQAHDRRLDPNPHKPGVARLYPTVAAAPILLERDVPLSRRGGGRPQRTTRTFPVRDSRIARLQVRAARLTISPGTHAPVHLPTLLTLNFVEVREVDPPEGEEPVLWRLATTEPIDSPEAVAAVVDMYRKRWVIEENFKALKTGCNFEKLQLESGHALLVALAIYVAVAWRLLRLRWLNRQRPDTDAAAVLTTTQLDVLRAVRAAKNKPLPPVPTVADVLTAIAALGGHIKNNGPPGWRVIGRGFDQLLILELGWRAATADGRSDQS